MVGFNFYTPAKAECILLSVSPSVRLSVSQSPCFGNNSQTARTIPIIFCMQLLFRMRRDDTKFRLGLKSIKWFFRGLGGGPISKLPLYSFIVWFFWNVEQFFSSLWNQMIQKGPPFLFWGGWQSQNSHYYYYLLYDFYKIWNIYSWYHYKVIQLGWNRNFRKGPLFLRGEGVKISK